MELKIERAEKMQKEWLEQAKAVLHTEAQAILAVAQSLNEAFNEAVDAILRVKGRMVVIGMGKSGIIAKKIAATFASTGTPAFFVHAAEAQHGDLGMITKDDLVLMLSHSGQTKELLGLLPVIKRLGIPLIAITGNLSSTLADHADIVLHVPVAKEACPMNLAPTASTTASLALGDALAVVVLRQRGFSPEDFARVHPAGSLGVRLTRVSELMHRGDELPLVPQGASLKETICVMSSKRLGIAGVVDGDRLVGCLSDGDLRRILEAGQVDLDATVEQYMHPNPHSISPDSLASEAVRRMEQYKITVLFVLDADGRPIGAVHMHDLLQAGVA